MARLRLKRDGDWYIRVYAGEDTSTGTQYFGTWQVEARGVDLLRRRHVRRDGDYVPPSVFLELLNQRLIWKGSSREAGSVQPSRNERAGTKDQKPSPRRIPSHKGKELYAPLPRRPPRATPPGLEAIWSKVDGLQSVPLDLFLSVGEQSWYLFLALDRRRNPGYDTRWVAGVSNSSLLLYAGDGQSPVDLTGSAGPARLDNLMLPVSPFHTDLHVELRLHSSVGDRRYHACSVSPLERTGTLFDGSGMRVRRLEPLSLDTEYYSVIHMNHIPSLLEHPTPGSCSLHVSYARDNWSLIRFTIYRRTDTVKEYLRQIGCELR